ncbi:transposase [Streptomyces sp. NPDC004520]|uniref:transposase n=1 Tax=Streptomyces sp. NPDC004520 TaxID=3364702 RepID=UPI0036912AB9
MAQGGVQVGRKSPYPEEFRRDAVALYRAAAEKRTYASMAADLGITAESLRTWVRKDEAQAAPEGRDDGVSTAEELARLRAENARLLKAEQEWQLEPDELQRLALVAVDPYVDRDVLARQIVREEQQRRALDGSVGRWGAPDKEP